MIKTKGHVRKDVSLRFKKTYIMSEHRIMRNIQGALPFLVLAFLLMLTACENKNDKRQGNDPFQTEIEEYPTYEELMRDSIAEKEQVGEACATTCSKLQQLVEELQNVQSPDALIKAKKQYLTVTASFNSDLNQLSEEEKKVATNYKTEADDIYQKVCQAYEVPANGVIENLNNLLKRIDGVKTKQELYRFQDCRLGMLRGLDDIHLCVEHNSRQIPEVRRLAQSLKSKYQAKKQEFGIE